eukprot:TRINITY_DN3896_c0_g1_i1.p1 TRINITY_DN3896_c0_g1~~TRINITY_DN3896_c0_g1_i1.p1  ORF type:complete len:951 (+),score=193.05 TRINITY_DN3896_c0_g1_i1:111-2963(+)
MIASTVVARQAAQNALRISEEASHARLGDLLQVLSNVVHEDANCAHRLLEVIMKDADISSSSIGQDLGEFSRLFEGFIEKEEAAERSVAPALREQAVAWRRRPMLARQDTNRSMRSGRSGRSGGSGSHLKNMFGDRPKKGNVAIIHKILNWNSSGNNAEPLSPVLDKEEDEDPAPWFPSEEEGYGHGICGRLFALFDDTDSCILSKVVTGVLMVAIMISTVSFVMESMPQYRSRSPDCELLRTVKACEPQPIAEFFPLEASCIALFTLDYAVRVLFVHRSERYEEVMPDSNGLMRTLRYMRQPMNIVDLLSVLPFYLDFAFADMGVTSELKVLRLMRVLRLFKIAKHHPGIKMFIRVLAMSGSPLLILVFFNVILNIIFAALIYYTEGREFSVDPAFTQVVDSSTGEAEKLYPTGVFVRTGQDLVSTEVTPFRSIPTSMWWVSVTMTTVGYGDYSPTTRIGKAIGVMCFYVGIIFLALPISVLGSNFEIVYQQYLESKAWTPTVRKAKKFRKLSVPFNQLPWFPQGRGLRNTVFMLCEDPSASKLSLWFSKIMIFVIIVSTTTFVLESMPMFNFTPADCDASNPTVEACKPRPNEYFDKSEVVCIALFTIDYFARALCVHSATKEECGCGHLTKDVNPFMLTLRYITQPLNIIDLAAILPFYIDMLAGESGVDTAVLRVLRLVRVFRVMKMPKLRSCAEMFLNVMSDALPALMILLFMTFLAATFFASCMVSFERSTYSLSFFSADNPYGLYIRPSTDGYQVEPSPFQDIVYTFWWFFTTATTVGYGDDYPTTTWGRILGVVSFYVGIVLLALPITIVGGSFQKFYPEWVSEFEVNAMNKERKGGQEPEETPEQQINSGSTLTPIQSQSPSVRSDATIATVQTRGDKMADKQDDSIRDSVSTVNPPSVPCMIQEAPKCNLLQPPTTNGGSRSETKTSVISNGASKTAWHK